jgi:hypothetical protein
MLIDEIRNNFNYKNKKIKKIKRIKIKFYIKIKWNQTMKD